MVTRIYFWNEAQWRAYAMKHWRRISFRSRANSRKLFAKRGRSGIGQFDPISGEGWVYRSMEVEGEQ